MSTIVNEIVLEDGQENPASLFVDENGKIKFKDRDSVSYFMSTLAAQGGVAKLIDAANGQPSDTLPTEVVVYIDLDDMQLYKRTESGWGVGFELRGEQGAQGPRGSKIFQGPSNPNVVSISDAEIGDIYIETGLTLTSRRMIWTKVSDTPRELKWQHAGLSFGRDGEDGVDGQPGERGRSVYEGAPDPNTLLPSSPNLPDGFFDAKNDDLYIETDSHLIWKKTDTGWVQRGATFRGRDGSPGPRVNGLFQGNLSPNSVSMRPQLVDAIIGDVYIEIDSHRLWKKIALDNPATNGIDDNLWQVIGESFAGKRGNKVFQGTNQSGDANIWNSDETLPSEFEEAIDGDIYFDTKRHQIWKQIDGSWISTGESYASSGIVLGLMDPNKFDLPTVEAASQYNLADYYDGNLEEFTKDYFSVKNSKINDSYMDTKNHLLYVKTRLSSSRPSGQLSNIWESKGLSFRGQDAYTSYLTNEFDTIAAGSTGATNSAGLSNKTGEFVVMKGNTKLVSPVVTFGYIDTQNKFSTIPTYGYSIDGLVIRINNEGIYEIDNTSSWSNSSDTVSFRLAAKIQDGVLVDNSDDTIIERVFKITKNKTGRFLVVRANSQIFKITSEGDVESDQESKFTANVKGNLSSNAIVTWKIYKILADGGYRLLADDPGDQIYFSQSEIDYEDDGSPTIDGDKDAITVNSTQFSNAIHSYVSPDYKPGKGIRIVASWSNYVVDEMSILSVNDGVPGKSVKLTSSTYSITYSTDGTTPTPNDNIVLTAVANNHKTAGLNYKFWSAWSDNPDARTYLGQDNSGKFTVQVQTTFPAYFTIPKTFIVETYESGVTEAVATDSVTIVGLKSGTNAITIIVSNPSHSFPTDGSGVIAASNYASGETEVYVFEGATALTAITGGSFTGNGQFRVVAGPPTGITYSSNSGAIVGGSNNKKLKFTPQSTSNLSLDVAKTTFSIYVKDLEGIEKPVITQEQTLTKSKAGADSKLLTLSVDKTYFNKSANGSFNPTNQIIRFTATLQNLTSALVLLDTDWEVYRVNSLGAEEPLTSDNSLMPNYLTITGNSATMNQDQYAAALGSGIEVRVKISKETLTSTVSITKLTDGTQQKIYIAGLSNWGANNETGYYANTKFDNNDSTTNGGSTRKRIYVKLAGVDKGYPNLSGNYSYNKDHTIVGGGRILDFSDEKINYGNFVTKQTHNSNGTSRYTTFQIKEAGKYKITVNATFRYANRGRMQITPNNIISFFSILRAKFNSVQNSIKFFPLIEESCDFGDVSSIQGINGTEIARGYSYNWSNDNAPYSYLTGFLDTYFDTTSEADEVGSNNSNPLNPSSVLRYYDKDDTFDNTPPDGLVSANNLLFDRDKPLGVEDRLKTITFNLTCNLEENDYLRFKARSVDRRIVDSTTGKTDDFVVAEKLTCWRSKQVFTGAIPPRYYYSIARNPQVNIVADASSDDDINDGDTVITIEKIS